MSHVVTEMHRLHRQILEMDAEWRHTMQPRLDSLIELSRQSGARVPYDIAQLNDALLDEAIEAQFNNLPV